MRTAIRGFLPVAFAGLLAACGTAPKAPAPPDGRPAAQRPASASPAATATLPPANKGRGGYYMDDGPPESVPENLLAVPDAQPKVEPYSVPGNRPYVVFGKTYTPITDDKAFVQRGPGTWYGKKFHGQKTSSGEKYDMFKMTAAHPTLPIPSYARVTNLSNGNSVIVRINDRGPFHSTRIIDLSYTAALKLGYLSNGSSQLEVTRLLPADILAMEKERGQAVSPEAIGRPVTPQVLAAIVESQPDVIGGVIANAANTVNTAASEGSSADMSVKPVSGIYLQFGAYGKVENAEAVLGRLLPKWGDDKPALEIVEAGPLFKVFSGPYQDRSAAQAAMQGVPGGIAKPVIVQR